MLAIGVAAIAPQSVLPAQSGGQAATAPTSPGAAVDSIILRGMSRRKVPGAAVAIMRDGVLLKSTAYGTANRATGEPVTTSTAFFVASITKAFTTATVLSLVARGELSLDAPARQYLPSLPASWHAVTVRHLLGMTSGLPDNAKDEEHGIYFPDFETALDSTAVRQPLGAPGTTRNYGGTDFSLLGRIVEVVTSKAFDRVVQERLLQPLGLRTAAFGDWHMIATGRAEWYSTFVPPDKFTADPYVLRTVYPRYYWPNAGMFISAEELATFVDAMGAGRVLPRAETTRYWSPVALANGTSEPATYGSWGVSAPPTPTHILWHEGGIRAGATYDPKTRLTIVILTNLQGGGPLSWIERIRPLYTAPTATDGSR